MTFEDDVDTAPSEPYRLRPTRMGVRPSIDLDKANSLAAELEDVELGRRHQLDG